MDGIYYQKTLGGGRGAKTAQNGRPSTQIPSRNSAQQATGPAQPISSAPASALIDSTSAALINEIQRRLNTQRWHFWAALPGLILLLIGATQQMQLLAFLGVGLATLGFVAGYVAFRFKSVSEVHYNLDPNYGLKYSQLLSGFDQLKRSQRLWQIETRSAVQNSKYHGGASYILSRKRMTASLGMPAFLNANLKVPMLVGSKQSIYFLPDVLLVVQGRRVGSVSYYYLGFASRVTTFIEHDSPPRDAQQVGSTWRFVNRAGGPDRRFANNRQLPIMQYAELRFESATGLNILGQVSNVQCAQAFVQGLSAMMCAARNGLGTKPHISP